MNITFHFNTPWVGKFFRPFLCACLVANSALYAVDADTYKDKTASVEDRVESLMKQMTLEEKVAQLEMFGVWNEKEFQKTNLPSTTGIGAWIGEVTPERYNEIQKHSEQSRLKIPVLVGVDAAHGHAILPNRTVFPTSITMAASFNPELVHKCAALAAQEIRSSGNHWTFAPAWILSTMLAGDARERLMEKTHSLPPEWWRLPLPDFREIWIPIKT